ncbi:Uncharacterized protein YjbI, contains pentapeptide repeats [Sulfitobacter marinus]|uniref:Uncharacterized protein YjbI, contains pentapeptide repeats n=1 Tax=Sulfitobacter marinus TaxID=394264 RepID=A0A1I6PV62_9RHOB|nr:pentapeptide repeat-containing protein [Sulfitobacter marinus]SFS44121.1 Uncharacterized protein YjbI, contains pentapeptide repeats [Sulfitobacter marinus]
MDDIIFQIDGRELLGIVLVLAFLFVPIGISFMPSKGDPSKPPLFDQLQKRLGLSGFNSGLLFVAIALWAVIFGSLVLGLLAVVWSFILAATPQGSEQTWDWRFSLAKMAALTATVGAVVALPFTMIRLTLTQRQTLAAEEGLITDRISKAVEGLGAEKTVKDKDDESTKPNLEVRIGAIYALERIAQDSLRDHIQIMEILCAYIRENAPLRETEKNPFQIWEDKAAEDADKPKMPGSGEIYTWAKKLPKPRTDIQVALEVIGRRASRQIKVEREATVRGSAVGYRLDLRSTCLQGADLRELEFTRCLFNQAQLQGADLLMAQLQGAELNGAELQGANLYGAKLQGARLGRAQLQGAYLSAAKLQGADLSAAQLQRAILSAAQLQGANLYRAKLQGANLSEAKLQEADLSRAELQEAYLSAAKLQGANLNRAQLQGAELPIAQLQGTRLFMAKFDGETSFGAANLRGAALKDVDFTQTNIGSDQITETFGDASVTLPGGHGPDHENWPEHWSKEKLKWEDFDDQWRAFQRSIGQDPDNPT